MDERLYTISFSKIYALGRHRERARKAIKFLRAFSARHMKTVEEKVLIGADVNEFIWRNGIQKPPRKLRVKMMKDKDGTVMVSLEQPEKQKESAKPKEKEKASVKPKTPPAAAKSAEAPEKKTAKKEDTEQVKEKKKKEKEKAKAESAPGKEKEVVNK